ncbi:MAG: hypothetical protein D3X82_16935 [Candidatus Leucobacter sulfamidivorax]|nr:hypothetical protein [Candidatus Leucobacter sulfamidivorax]
MRGVRDDEAGQRPCVAPWRSLSGGSADTGEYVRRAGGWGPVRLGGETQIKASAAANTDHQFDVVFSTPFRTIPIVTAVPGSGDLAGTISVGVSMITASGFRLVGRAGIVRNIWASWLAVA